MNRTWLLVSGEPREEWLPLFHAKRFGFFGTVLVCTVLLTACPGAINPIAPGYLSMEIPQDVFEPCTTDFALRLSADGVLVYENKREDQSLLAPVLGIQRGFYRIPGEMQTGALLRIDIECYGQGRELIEAYKYQDTIRYPVFSKSGAFLYAGPRYANDSREDCISGELANPQNETRLCIQTNLFSEFK